MAPIEFNKTTDELFVSPEDRPIWLDLFLFMRFCGEQLSHFLSSHRWNDCARPCHSVIFIWFVSVKNAPNYTHSEVVRELHSFHRPVSFARISYYTCIRRLRTGNRLLFFFLFTSSFFGYSFLFTPVHVIRLGCFFRIAFGWICVLCIHMSVCVWCVSLECAKHSII